MSRENKFLMVGSRVLWPALFVPYASFDRDEPKYQASFIVPDNVVPPAWLFVKTLDEKYGFPAGSHVISTSSRSKMPVFGIDKLHLKDMQDCLVNIDSLIHRAACNVVLTARQDSKGKYWAEAAAIDLSPALIVCPDFNDIARGVQQ